MPTAYPSTLPGPTLAGFGARVAMGVIRADDVTHEQQRRVFKSMPHTFSLAFVMSLVEWAQWKAWVTDNGYGWFEIDIPTLYDGRVDGTPAVIRLTSEVTASMLAHDVVQVSVTAEMAPSMIDNYLANVP
jgi:hypothetical protein